MFKDGFSLYPTPPETRADVVEVQHLENMKTIRLSFRPSYSAGQHPYLKETVKYVLNNTPSDVKVVIDANHLTPPNTNTANQAFNNWDSIKSRLHAVINDFGNNRRVGIEVINELATSTDNFYNKVQGLIDTCRNIGFNGPLVYNKLTGVDGRNNWKKLHGKNLFDGYHIYFNENNYNTMIQSMNTARSLGINVLNTETGPSFNENPTVNQVLDCNRFYEKCASIGVSNCTWLAWGDINYNWFYKLKDAGLKFSYQTVSPISLNDEAIKALAMALLATGLF